MCITGFLSKESADKENIQVVPGLLFKARARGSLRVMHTAATLMKENVLKEHMRTCRKDPPRKGYNFGFGLQPYRQALDNY